MEKIYFKDLEKYKGEKIEVQGFIDNIKDLKNVQFIILRDGTGKLQVTIEKDENNKEINNMVSLLTNESTIKVLGVLMDSPSVRLNGMEFIPEKIIITSLAQQLPIDYKDQSVPRSIRHDNRFLDLRKDNNHKVFEVETAIEENIRNYCLKNDFIELHSPKITAKAAESGSEVFKVDFFGQSAALSQSPQFYKQMAMVSGFNKVFEIGPAFRAEKSNTSYHASEINMCDIEFSWIDSIKKVEALEEEMLKFVFENINKKYGDIILKRFNGKLVNVDVDFPVLSFDEAKEVLKEKYHYISEKDSDLERKEEMLLCKYAIEKFKSDFVFIEGFPFSNRAFYQQKDDNGITKSYDLLYRGVEITTGALREHRYDVLLSQILEKGINPEDLKYYLEMFKYGCPPHGGYGIGLSRVLMKTLNIDNIMDTNFIYRGPSRKLKM